MAGNRGVYADGPQPYHGQDDNRDLATVLSVPQQLMQDLTGGSNLVVSGFALSVVSGMQVQVAVGICWANGLRAATVLTPLTINTTTTQPRYTIIRVTVTPNNPNGTDGTTGNNLIADTNVVDFVDGAPGSSPIKPTLSSAYQVQVGSILLPAGTSTLTSGMLNTLDCAPNSIGPDGSELVSSYTHRQASMAAAVVHGFQASPPGGFGAGNANRLAQLDGNGRVGDSGLLGGLAPSAYQPAGSYDASGSAAAVTAALVTHEGAAVSAGAVHGANVRHSTTTQQVCNNQTQVSWSVSFSPAFAGGVTPDVQLTPVASALYNQQYGSQCYAVGLSNTGMTIYFGQTSGGAVTVAVSWRAEASS